MYRQSSIAVVVPCFNESHQISRVVDTMPEIVDLIIIVDDCSADNTCQVIESHPLYESGRVWLIRHQINQGVGGAIASGYKYALQNNFDAAVVMAGDGQMDPSELPALLDPIIDDEADYTKGNRLVVGNTYNKIPFARLFGNSVLSLLTKIASGYWHISDSQTGYTAISKLALKLINWDSMYKRYGQPNDLLIRLNVADLRVLDVPMEPVYDVGEVSGIKIPKVIPKISKLLFKQFFWRLKEKYIIRGFHPLVLFYLFGFIAFITAILFLFLFIYKWIALGFIPEISLLLFLFSFALSFNAFFFAMFMDYEDNKDLNPRLKYSKLRRYFGS